MVRVRKKSIRLSEKRLNLSSSKFPQKTCYIFQARYRVESSLVQHRRTRE